MSNRLAQEAWITTQQRINLNKLIVSNPDCTPADCCEIAHQLDDAHFVEAHESIGYDVSWVNVKKKINKNQLTDFVYRIHSRSAFLYKNSV